MFNSAGGSAEEPSTADYGQGLQGHDFALHPSHHPFQDDTTHQAPSASSAFPPSLDDLAVRGAYGSSLTWAPPLAPGTNRAAIPPERRPDPYHNINSPYRPDTAAATMPLHVSPELHDPSTSRSLDPASQVASSSMGGGPPPYFSSLPGAMQVHMDDSVVPSASQPLDHWGHRSAPHMPSYAPSDRFSVMDDDAAERAGMPGPSAFTSMASTAPNVLASSAHLVHLPSGPPRRTLSHQEQSGLNHGGRSIPSPKPQSESRQSRKYLPADKWESFKPIIRQLYLEERKPLKEVMRIMNERHGFEASPKMYKTRFSQWGFAKNNTEEEVKKLLAMKFERDAKGKVSEFIRNGRPVNIRNYLKRKGVTEYDLVDLESNTELPAHVRCRTPTPPPAPSYLRSPDQLRAQELLIGNMKRIFIHLRQHEIETSRLESWSATLTWGAASSDLIYEAGRLFGSGQNDMAGDILVRAFKQLEVDLQQLSSQGLRELVLAMAHRNLGMVTAVSKYVGAYTATNFERAHPLRLAFACLYEVQQQHGPAALTDLVWSSVPALAEEMERIYGRQSPCVTRFWLDLAMLHNYVNTDQLQRLYNDLKPLEQTIVEQYGLVSAESFAFQITRAYMLYLTSPYSEAEREAVTEAWHLCKEAKLAHRVKGRPDLYCYHSLLRVEPWMKPCKEKYAVLTKMMQRTTGVELVPYFVGEPHLYEHADDDVGGTDVSPYAGPS